MLDWEVLPRPCQVLRIRSLTAGNTTAAMARSTSTAQPALRAGLGPRAPRPWRAHRAGPNLALADRRPCLPAPCMTWQPPEAFLSLHSALLEGRWPLRCHLLG